jgi:L-fuculose-phosphate aldolase
MADIRTELVSYGGKIVRSGLVAGAGGNISARDGDTVWLKPSGMAMDEMGPDDLCGLDVETGRQLAGPHRPTSEVAMHLAVYRVRPDVRAVFHTHSPWACGVISAGVELRPMFAEFVNDLGRTATVPYITPTTRTLAQAVEEKVKTSETVFMVNHGILAVGVHMRQAYYRCLVVEDAAKSLVAATVVGKPQFLTRAEVDELMALEAAGHRVRMMETQGETPRPPRPGRAAGGE